MRTEKSARRRHHVRGPECQCEAARRGAEPRRGAPRAAETRQSTGETHAKRALVPAAFWGVAPDTSWDWMMTISPQLEADEPDQHHPRLPDYRPLFWSTIPPRNTFPFKIGSLSHPTTGQMFQHGSTHPLDKSRGLASPRLPDCIPPTGPPFLVGRLALGTVAALWTVAASRVVSYFKKYTRMHTHV